jgi:hypothetical protein
MCVNIEEKLSKIRIIINEPYMQNKLIQRKKDWNRLCVCLDTIEDTEYALSHYLELPAFNAYNGGYLFLYGLLQAIYTQQDAIISLYESLLDRSSYSKEFFSKYSSLKKIREIRNDVIGHPTNRRGGLFYGIVQVSIKKNSFTKSWFNANREYEHESINTIKCIEDQRVAVVEFLTEINKKLKEEVEMHKDKFKKVILKNFFKNYLYCIGKLSDCFYNNGREYGKENMAFEQLELLEYKYHEFIEAVIKREGFLLESIGFYQPKIDYTISRIHSFKDNKGLYENIEASTLIDVLGYYMKKLELIAEEIDNEYKK